MLASCDRGRTVGLRDYAILLLLTRLGLRASEIGRISLEDVDWRAGQILIHGKGNRQDYLPLPADVGQALVDYLQSRAAAPEGCRVLFLKVLAPVGPMSRSTVSAVVREACLRAGIPRVCPHRLRHTAATSYAGVDITVIALWLGHEQTSTTEIYLHADMETKVAALERTRPPEVLPGTYTPNPGILTWLEAL